MYQYKRSASIQIIDIIEIVVSNKANKGFFGKKGFKYFISQNNTKEIRPPCISLAKISAYRRDSGETKYICFLKTIDKLLEKHNDILEKVKNSIKKECDSEPVYNEKYVKAETKSYKGKINTNFYNNKIPK